MKKYFEIRTRKGKLDDLVFSNVDIHIEQMDEDCWWLGIYKGKKRISFMMSSTKPIKMRIQDQELPVRWVEQDGME